MRNSQPHGMTGKQNNPMGRPKGSSNKLSGASILQAIEAKVGMPFEEALADGYYDAIINNDRALRQKYEQMMLNKVVADKQEIDVTTLGDSLNDRKTAFETIISKLKGGSDATNEVNE